MDSREEVDRRTEIIDACLHGLMEHFEAVQILATTRIARGETFEWMRGSGNWFARCGLAHSFIDKDVAQDIGVEVANALEGEDES